VLRSINTGAEVGLLTEMPCRSLGDEDGTTALSLFGQHGFIADARYKYPAPAVYINEAAFHDGESSPTKSLSNQRGGKLVCVPWERQQAAMTPTR